MRLLLACMLMLVGCGSSTVEPSTTSGTSTTAPNTATTAATAESTTTEHDEANARAVAESFVRAQGYADTPCTLPEEAIVHEGIEGTIEDRRNSLDPHAVSVSRMADGWYAVFRYVAPEFADRGRQLRMPDGETPHFVHQDMLLHPSH